MGSGNYESPCICLPRRLTPSLSTPAMSTPAISAIPLKDPGAEITMVKAEIIQDTNFSPAGTIVIRGVFCEPLCAKLVMMTVKQDPESGFDYIGPALNVIFAVCPLTTDTDTRGG